MHLIKIRLGGFFLQVTLPFFVLHGEADIVTDPEVSRALYERASSADKTLKMYPEMWHGLTSGEPDENIDIVFRDIIDWLEKHTTVGNAITVHPIHPFKNGSEISAASAPSALKNGIAISATSAPSATINRQQPQRTDSQGSYCCGLKGRRTRHHSAM